MKLRIIRLMLAALFCASQSVNADILILKNGDKKEGNILEERPDAIRMKYRITPKIWDEKDFPRADIQQIIKQKPEEIEIVDLRKVLPAPDLLTANDYEQIIQDRLRPFINKYPGTSQAQEVETMIAELQKEKDRVVAGELKMEGQWLTAETANRDDYNIQAYKVRRSINENAAAGDYAGALRKFELFRDPARGYPASLHFAACIPEVIAILDAYEKQILQMIVAQPLLQKRRADGLIGKVPPELTTVQRAIDKEIAEWKATYESEKKARIRWQTLYKYDLKSLQDAHKMVGEEKNKLKLLDQAGLTTRNEALTKAIRYISDGNTLEAEAVLKTASLSIKTGQALVMADASRIITQLRSRLTLLKAEQAKNKSINKTFGAGSSAVGAGSGAIQDDRVAQAMAEAEKTKEAKKAAAAEPEKKDAADKPAGDKPAEDKKAGDAKGDDEGKAKSKASRSKSPTAMVAPVEEEGGMQTYLLIGAAILVVVLLAAFLMQKKKAK